MGQKRKIPPAAAALLLLCAAAPASAIQAIKTETWINSADGSGTFTTYQYDAEGSLARKLVYKSLDNSGSQSSQTDYTYDASQKLTSEKISLPNAPGTTTEYVYDDAARLSLMIGKSDDGSEKYRDSLFYNPSGVLAEQRSYKGGSLVFKHRFGLAADGKSVSDTSFESDGSSFVPTQAVVVTSDASGKPSLETRSRKVAGSWYVSTTKSMEYGQGNLLNLREYEGPAVAANLLTTLSYLYDGQGRKIREDLSEGAGKVLSSTTYEWSEVGSTAIRTLARDASHGPTIRIQGPYMTASGNSLRLMDLRGRLLYPSQDIGRGQTIHLASPSILTIPKSGGSPLQAKGR